VLRGTDSSLLDEWEKLRDPNYKPDEVEEKPVAAPDITRNKREFTALIRTEIFRYLQQLIRGQIDLPELDDYYADHDRIRLDNEARNGRHTYVQPSDDGQTWRVNQVLIDPEELNDWQLEFRVDLPQALEDGKPTLEFVSLSRIG
jgi:hypothetical protein